MESMAVNVNEMAGGVGMLLAGRNKEAGLVGVTAGVAVMEARLADCCLVESGWVR
jgi:hypothetical protein